MKNIKLLMVFMLLLLTAVVIVGCGASTQSSSYFYAPSWTRGGAIIFTGELSSSSKDWWGGQTSASFSQYVRTIYPAGTGESSSLFDTTSNPPYAMVCSPVTDYVAYGNDLRSGLYRTIVVRNISTATHTGLEITELAFNPGVKAFDWSNDGTKLVYCTSTEVRTININGSADTLVLADTNLEFVAWQYGGRIAFIRTVSSVPRLSLIYPDGTGRLDLAAAVSVNYPQVSSSNTSEVFGLSDGGLAKVSNIDTSPALTVLKANSNASLPRLSADAKYLTYSKSTESTGIYFFDVTTLAETKVK